MKHRILFAVFGCSLAIQPVSAQKQQQPINIGASFLLVNPDARSTGLGNAVTGIAPDVNALSGNAAKLPFAGDWGVSASYSPWMRDLNDHETNMTYVSAFKTWSGKESAGLSVRYFNYGEVTFRDDNGMELQLYTPKEFSIDAAYARKLSDQFSLSVSLRYIRSELGNGTYNGQMQKPASAVAGDVAIYYQGYADNLDYGNRYSWGLSITNLGSRLQYSDNSERKSFLPMNLRIGGGYSFVHTDYHTFTLAADINKLLVPTPPQYKLDDNNNPTSGIEKGKDPNRGVVNALFSSFTDAPGGFQEELREFSVASGLEYAYQQNFFVRAGYFYEHPHKGNRQHFSAGMGVSFSNIHVDVAYLLPTGTSLRQRKSFALTITYGLSHRSGY